MQKGRYTYASMWLGRFIVVHPASAFRDSAMYLLGETHYGLGEYLTAANEFERIINTFPNSPLCDDALYKAGYCYYNLSPSFDRDQENTIKSIERFQRLAEDYPDSPHLKEVNKIIPVQRNKLAKKDFKSGELYHKMKDYEAAVITYERVTKIFYDTEWASLALFGKGKCLAEQKKYKEAREVYEEFLKKYPKHILAIEAKESLNSLPNRDLSSEGAKTTSR